MIRAWRPAAVLACLTLLACGHDPTDPDPLVGDDDDTDDDPYGPGDLVDCKAWGEATLDDVGWVELSRRELDGGVVEIVGDFSGGEFATINAMGEPQQLEGGLHEAAAIYLPPGFPDGPADAAGVGIVHAVHGADQIVDGTTGELAAMLGLPILRHGQYSGDITAFGYGGRNDLTWLAGGLLMERNTCELTDTEFGGFVAKLVEVDARAITLLQRIAEEESGIVDRVGLYGGSKEGYACWLASGCDPRITAAACHGFHIQDSRSLAAYETDWYCDPEIQSRLLFLDWLTHSPAGQQLDGALSVPAFEHQLYPSFFFLYGDIGMDGMHDANHFPQSQESAFLESFGQNFRYWRGETNTPLQGVNTYAILAERLRLGDAAMDAEHPKITSLDVHTDGRRFAVTLTAAPAPDGAELWWTHSPDRRYNDPGQADWQRLVLDDPGDGVWVSELTDEVPAGEEAAYFVQVWAERSPLGVPLTHPDASSVRFLFRTEAGACTDLQSPDWCGDDPDLCGTLVCTPGEDILSCPSDCAGPLQETIECMAGACAPQYGDCAADTGCVDALACIAACTAEGESLLDCTTSCTEPLDASSLSVFEALAGCGQSQGCL